MRFENNKEIVLNKDAQVVIDRYLYLSMNVISEFIDNSDRHSFQECKETLTAKYRARSQNTCNDFFECTLAATFILLEKIFLEHQPFFPDVLMGICSGRFEFFLAHGVMLPKNLDPQQNFIIYLRKGRYLIYFLDKAPTDVVEPLKLGLFFGGNKLLKLSNGQRFNYFRQLSKKKHRYYKQCGDPIKAYHEQICRQIKALHPKTLVLACSPKITGAYLEEQIRLRRRIAEVWPKMLVTEMKC